MTVEHGRQRPPVAVPDPPPQREPVPARVGRIQDELGIRAERRLEEYGPTSAFTEELLWRGYGLRREVER